MMSPRTILAPVDFSELTEFETRNAADIARRFGSRLIFLHVISKFAETPPTDPAAAEAYAQEFSADVEKGLQSRLDAIAARVAGDLEVESQVLTGEPGDKIVEFAQSRDVGLVVMPTTPKGRVRRQLQGSVAGRMLQDLTCPLFTGIADWESVKQEQKSPFQRIACKIEPSERVSEQLRWAKAFGETYGGSLIVIGVLPFVDTIGATPPMPEHLRGPAMEDAKRKLESLCREEGVEAEVAVLGGPIDEVLTAFVAEKEIDLLVSARHRYQDTVGLFGIHTDIMDTVQSVPCSMVLV